MNDKGNKRIADCWFLALLKKWREGEKESKKRRIMCMYSQQTRVREKKFFSFYFYYYLRPREKKRVSIFVPLHFLRLFVRVSRSFTFILPIYPSM